MKRLAILGLAVALTGSSANAQVLFQDTFAGLNGGNTAFNFNGFPNWAVTGQVDLVRSGDFGVTCSGMCVDLDGSPGSGDIKMLNAIGFAAGDFIKLSISISGNQRTSGSDSYFLGMDFGFSGANIGDAVGTGGFAGLSGPVGNVSFTGFGSSIAASTPMSIWTLQFEALSAGAIRYSFGTASNDNAGPILDDVLVEKVQVTTVAPEPSSWAMLAFGLGGVGVAARRRVRRR